MHQQQWVNAGKVVTVDELEKRLARYTADQAANEDKSFCKSETFVLFYLLLTVIN